MVSKKKIGICLAAITFLSLLVMVLIGNSYEDKDDLFWGMFAVIVTVMFLSCAIVAYMLSVHFKETKPKLSKFLYGFGIYILAATVGGIVYSVLNLYGVIGV